MSQQFSLGPHSVRVLADLPTGGFAEGTFAPNVAGPPAHSHGWDEGFYVLEGSIRVELDGESVVLEKGDFALAPGGSVHTFEVHGTKPATFLATFSSPAGLAYLRDMAAILGGGLAPEAVESELAQLRDAFGVVT